MLRMFADPDYWLMVILGIVILYGFWHVLRTRWVVRVVVNQNGVKSCRGVPKAREKRVRDFLQNDVSFSGKVTIRVVRSRSGYLRVAFSGPIDQGTQQRIRNFLVSVL